MIYFSTALATYFPVSLADVGPNSPEETLSIPTSDFPVMLLYPNPTKGSFELSIPTLQNKLTIELYNIHGQVITKGTYTVVSVKIQLNLDNQPAGLYILRVNLDGNIINYKVIKQ